MANEVHAEIAQILTVHALEQVARDSMLHKLLSIRSEAEASQPLANGGSIPPKVRCFHWLIWEAAVKGPSGEAGRQGNLQERGSRGG